MMPTREADWAFGDAVSFGPGAIGVEADHTCAVGG